MCGLVGVISLDNGLYHKFDSYFEQALVANSLRGMHSTGMFVLGDDLKGKLHKKAVDGIAFVSDHKFRGIVNYKLNKVLMGHNRYATVGKIDDNNAHPFNQNGIVLAHNGTLKNYSTLSTKKFQTDSELIAYLLSKSKSKKDVLEKLEGSYALSWYDYAEKTFNLARNKERSLYYAEAVYKIEAYGHRIKEQEHKAVVYSSERGLMEWIANRNGLKLSLVQEVPIGQIISYNLKNKVASVTSTPFTIKETIDSHDNYFDYKYYYRTPKNTTQHHVTYNSTSSTDEKSKYIDLIGTVFQGFFDHFEPHPNNSVYGKMVGTYNKPGIPELSFEYKHVTRNDIHKYLIDDALNFRITGVNKDNVLSVILISTKICNKCKNEIKSQESYSSMNGEYYHLKCMKD